MNWRKKEYISIPKHYISVIIFQAADAVVEEVAAELETRIKEEEVMKVF